MKADGDLMEEPDQEVEGKRGTSITLRKDAALLRAMLAEDFEKRENQAGSKQAEKPKKRRRKRSTVISQKLTSMQEEAPGDVSSDDDVDAHDSDKEVEEQPKIGP